MKYTINLFAIAFLATFLIACGSDEKKTDNAETKTQPPVSMLDEPDDPKDNKGIGPISSVELGDLDEVMAKAGEELYQEKCTACHAPDSDLIGPSPKGILDRRSPEWVMNMILNPTEMIQNDPIAMQLLEDYKGVPMTNQELTEEQARSVLEYFRTLD
jgi:hypothetical protein